MTLAMIKIFSVMQLVSSAIIYSTYLLNPIRDTSPEAFRQSLQRPVPDNFLLLESDRIKQQAATRIWAILQRSTPQAHGIGSFTCAAAYAGCQKCLTAASPLQQCEIRRHTWPAA